MIPGFTQAAILAVIIVLSQTTKRINGDESSADSESYVLSLTKNTFHDTIKDHKFVLVKFVAPWYLLFIYLLENFLFYNIYFFKGAVIAKL